ncbi:MAG: universal stress protein [Chloroflexota bacterium]|nr:universal stress protein [Chloroflexota bacterium]
MHIIVATDGSPQARRACAFGVDLADRYEAKLTVLHVAVPVALSSFDSPGSALRTAAAAYAHAERILAAVRAMASPRVPVETELLFGSPAQRICERAQELDADLIVLGRQSLGAVERLLWGSVSETVLRRAPCSVLVVQGEPLPRPPDRWITIAHHAQSTGDGAVGSNTPSLGAKEGHHDATD